MREPTDLETWHPFAQRFAFLAKPKTRRNFIYVPAAVLAVSVILGFWAMGYLKDHEAPWDFFGAWAVWGFLSYSFVVLMARPLFALLARREGYYGPDEWTGGVERDERLAPAVEPEPHDGGAH